MRQLLAGVWAAIVALGSAYGGLFVQQMRAERSAAATSQVSLEAFKLRKLNVPHVVDGEVQGYVVAQLSAIARSDALKAQPLRPDPILLDEAFKVLFASEAVDYRKPKPDDLAALTRTIAGNVNKRLGNDVIKEILVEEFSYVPRSEIRSGRSNG